jgi:hypothetical protein
MKAKGIRRISCFNGGLLGEVYSLNARMFALESHLKDVKARMGHARQTLTFNRGREDFTWLATQQQRSGGRKKIWQ